QAHRDVGSQCDPDKLDVVITVGADAGKFLAPAARKRGCNVQSFVSPYDAGKYARSILKEGAVVLAKGSQNRVFTEEALKSLLAQKSDMSKLVRQSASWMKIKLRQFEP